MTLLPSSSSLRRAAAVALATLPLAAAAHPGADGGAHHVFEACAAGGIAVAGLLIQFARPALRRLLNRNGKDGQ